MDIKYLGKFLIASLFVVMGLYALLFNFDKFTEAVGSKGIPYPVIVAFIVLLWHIIPGIIIMISKNPTYVRWAAISLIVFVALASVLYHNVYQDKEQLQNMMKNMALIGALLLIIANETD